MKIFTLYLHTLAVDERITPLFQPSLDNPDPLSLSWNRET